MSVHCVFSYSKYAPASNSHVLGAKRDNLLNKPTTLFLRNKIPWQEKLQHPNGHREIKLI